MKKKKLILKKDVPLTMLQASIVLSTLTMTIVSLLAINNNTITLLHVIATMTVFFGGTILISLLDDFKPNKKTHEKLENLESQVN